MLKNKTIFSLLIATIFTCSACSSTTPESVATWKTSGSVVMAGPIPSVSTLSSRAMLGFMPSKITAGKTWLSINTQDGSVNLMKGNLPISTVTSINIGRLPKGHYEIALKQHDALWHASDEYFNNRQLEVPALGSRERYLRGALGSSVLYLNEEIAIHNSEIDIPEVSGVRLSANDMNAIYDQLEVGSYIEVE